MSESSHLTVGQVADFFQAPEWRIRKIVDSMGADIPRAGGYRLIARSLLPAIGAKLQASAPAQEVPHAE
jgi:hypothetical protein